MVQGSPLRETDYLQMKRKHISPCAIHAGLKASIVSPPTLTIRNIDIALMRKALLTNSFSIDQIISKGRMFTIGNIKRNSLWAIIE